MKGGGKEWVCTREARSFSWDSQGQNFLSRVSRNSVCHNRIVFFESRMVPHWGRKKRCPPNPHLRFRCHSSLSHNRFERKKNVELAIRTLAILHGQGQRGAWLPSDKRVPLLPSETRAKLSQEP